MSLKNRINKRGLTGDSGFVAPGLHISASYSCNGLVFVEVEHPEYGTVWERMSAEEAQQKGLEIIKCSRCDNYATSLDHYFPYMQDRNLCDECIGK